VFYLRRNRAKWYATTHRPKGSNAIPSSQPTNKLDFVTTQRGRVLYQKTQITTNRSKQLRYTKPHFYLSRNVARQKDSRNRIVIQPKELNLSMQQPYPIYQRTHNSRHKPKKFSLSKTHQIQAIKIGKEFNTKSVNFRNKRQKLFELAFIVQTAFQNQETEEIMTTTSKMQRFLQNTQKTRKI